MDQDFLIDPEEKFLGSENRHLKKTADLIPDSGPLVLFGEPGLGKSTELESIADVCGRGDGTLIRVDFREIGDFATFAREVFESSRWNNWINGEDQLTLIVDAVDEGIVRIPKFIEELTRELRNFSIERLRLFLACRTAEWPKTVEAPLLGLWNLPEDDRRLFELCPLRRDDVVLAVEAMGTSSEEFFAAVYNAHVKPLAARPVTLAFLLKEFRANGDFGKNHRELYEKGAEMLCNEHDPRRRELTRRLRKSTTIVSTEERLAAAREIAINLLLSGNSSIEMDGEMPGAWIDAVETALFTSVGLGKFAFIHRTIAECLASSRLAELPVLQLRRLLCHRDGMNEYVAPQLSELAAWTAGYHFRFLEYVLHIDPTVLLRSDITRIQGVHKVDLVDALLQGAEREEVFDEFEYKKFYRGLLHDGLSDQLKPYISDRGKGGVVRRLAFDIAEECRLPELVEDLFCVLRDRLECQQIREAASQALCECIPESRLKELIPLAQGKVGADPQDSIRGDALKKLVPKVLAVRDALTMLRAPREVLFAGSYQVFLHYDCPRSLTEGDVGPVLEKLADWSACFDSINVRKELAEKAFCMGLAMIGDPQIAEKLVRIWLEKTRKYHAMECSKILDLLGDKRLRRAFATAILNDERTTKDDVCHLLSSSLTDWRVVRSDDLSWLLNALAGAPEGRMSVWAHTVSTAMWWWDHVKCWDLFLEKRESLSQLSDAFPLMLEIDAPDSRKAKASYLRHERRMRRLNEKKSSPKMDVERLIAADLDRFRKGEKAAWYRLLYDLFLEPGDVRYRRPHARVVESPGWLAADAGMREVFTSMARWFLLEFDDGYAEYGGPSKYSDAGMYALELLSDDLIRDGDLQDAVRSKWLRSVVSWFSDESGRANELFSLAYRFDSRSVIQAMLSEATVDAEKHGHIFAFRRGKSCWDNGLSSAVQEFVYNCDIIKAVGSAIVELSDLDADAADVLVGRCLDRFSGPDLSSEGLVEVISAALKSQLFGSWERVFLILSNDLGIARDAFLSAAQEIERAPYLALTEEQIADLYILIARIFPPKDDPPDPSGRVTSRQAISYVRANLLAVLSSKANESACAQFLRLAAEMPDQATWLRWRYVNTLRAKRRSEWVPLDVGTIDRLVSNPESRLINNEDDLLEVTLESLERLQVYLRGTNNPAVEDIWNHTGAGNKRSDFRPKDEEFISDYVARWLNRDLAREGLIVNREVQPVRASRTDILVQMNLPSTKRTSTAGEQSLSLTIEVKGCWNAGILTAVEEQLVGRYLQPFGRTHGIYLVAWFMCPDWQTRNSPLGDIPFEDARKCVEQLCISYDGRKSPTVVRGVTLDARLK